MTIEDIQTFAHKNNCHEKDQCVSNTGIGVKIVTENRGLNCLNCAPDQIDREYHLQLKSSNRGIRKESGSDFGYSSDYEWDNYTITFDQFFALMKS